MKLKATSSPECAAAIKLSDYIAVCEALALEVSKVPRTSRLLGASWLNEKTLILFEFGKEISQNARGVL